MINNDKNSEISDISMQTDVIVFKGGLGLTKGNQNNSQPNSNNPNSSPKNKKSKTIKNKLNPNNTTDNSNILQENNINSYRQNNGPNGILSFRSKKDVQGFNQLSINKSTDETVDTISITQQIIDKLGVLKTPVSKKKSDVSTYPKAEKEEISKVFIKPMLTEPEENEKEIKNFEVENEFPVMDEYDNNNLEICGEYPESEEHEDEESEIVDEKNIFWNLKKSVDEPTSSDKGRSRSVIDRKSIIEKRLSNSKDKKSNRKETFISSITCTLSRIEKGKAIFVSTDDFIFVLPALFVPKNLIVGNTYVFRISEFEKLKSKLSNISDLQKKYSNKIKNNKK